MKELLIILGLILITSCATVKDPVEKECCQAKTEVTKESFIVQSIIDIYLLYAKNLKGLPKNCYMTMLIIPCTISMTSLQMPNIYGIWNIMLTRFSA